jgi:hypothetical protein
LKEKEEKIKQLNNIISKNDGSKREEIFALSDLPPLSNPSQKEQPLMKMTRQDFIMAQIDLDVIESHGS